jgi:hypothetical protein
MNECEQIRALNDAFRQNMKGGRLVATTGVAGRSDLEQLIGKVRAFSKFSPDNDPYGEHDFGAFCHGGQRFYWKIDYYDQSLSAGSPDPSDETKTVRVLTIMLSEEY